MTTVHTISHLEDTVAKVATVLTRMQIWGKKSLAIAAHDLT